MIKKGFIILLFVFSLSLIVSAYVLSSNPVLPEVKDIIPHKQETKIYSPARLEIPSLSVNAPIESVGQDAKKNMGVPKDSDNVAWYNLGYVPGQNGNAVIAGHFDRTNGAPAVFYHLSDLHIGENIYTIDKKGNRVEWVVVGKSSYPANSFPVAMVFGKANTAKLNLITCEGVFQQGSYTQRLVVYSELKSDLRGGENNED